jgi:hypothetical protein
MYLITVFIRSRHWSVSRDRCIQTTGSLPYSQEPATGSYPESDASNPQVHYRIHKSLLLVLLPSQMHPIHRFITVFTEAYYWSLSSVRCIQSTGSLPYSQEPATGLYPQPDASNPQIHYRVHKIPPLVPVSSLMNHIHGFITMLTKSRHWSLSRARCIQSTGSLPNSQQPAICPDPKPDAASPNLTALLPFQYYLPIYLRPIVWFPLNFQGALD